MFDAINERLTDDTFIQQSIKMRDDSGAATGAAATAAAAAGSADTGSATGALATGAVDPNSRSSTADGGMTDADAKCYEGRFTDIGNMTAREHYAETGSEQGRLATCAPNLTDYQAKQYIK